VVASLAAAGFPIDELQRDPSSIVLIAPDGRIVWANAGWFRFAIENGGERAAIREGDNYLASIEGEVRAFFEGAASECLAKGEPFEQDYECSTATLYRAFRLRMLPIAREGLLLTHSPIAIRPHDRAAEPPDETRFRDVHGLIAQCSYCRRIRAVDQSWHWVPAWVKSMPQRVTHGICAQCMGFYWPPDA
jgi:hypothetical protein